MRVADGSPPPYFSKRPSLLIIDDQPANIQILYEIFQRDHEVFFATSGEMAIDMCRKNMPDLILLDVVMPKMCGLEVCRQLKSASDAMEVPIIFVTAQSSPEDETLGLEAGAVDFISKPVNPAVVRARVRTHLTLKAQSDLLRSMAFIDGLTGVANRRHFDENLKAEWHRCQRHGLPIALLLADIDHFKRYNDRYGHQAGDDCLRRVAEILKGLTGRSHDLVARYGGEEFVCLLPDIDMNGALFMAEKFVQTVYASAIPHAASDTALVVTISVGVAVTVPVRDRIQDELLAAADVRLYRAKAEGRNRVSSLELR